MRWIIVLAVSLIAVSLLADIVAIESLSHPDLEVSIDRGRTWRCLEAGAPALRGTIHLRWRLDKGQGRMSYRVVVR